MLDTNVLIHIRDGDPDILAEVAELNGAVLMSIVSRVELEGGVYRESDNVQRRRARLNAVLEAIPAVAFDDESADAYATIVATTGYARRTLLDRMIAAQALVHRATLVTRNPGDFADIPGLVMVVW